jgi:chromosome segregation ATPase
VAPKRAALAAAQESLDKTLAELASAQARLQAVQEKIANLEAQFEEATAKKASLAAQVLRTGLALQLWHNGHLPCDADAASVGRNSSRWRMPIVL